MTVSEGSYQFEIANEGVGHNVGFVLVPKGMYDASKHIKAAYVKAPVADGSSSMTNIVNLKAGEYEYFCPMNPTPKYSLTVTDGMDKSMMKDKMHKDGMKDKMGKVGMKDKMDKSDKM